MSKFELMKVILIHGKDTDPSQKWYPWFAEEVRKLGYQFIAPALPNASDPVMNEWLAEIDKTNPDADTMLIGHSRGGVAVMRWLEKQPPEKHVKKVILIATNSGRLKDKMIPKESNFGFYTEDGYDFEKIKSHCNDFVVLHSKDDQWVPFSAGEMNAASLNARFLKFDNHGHFGRATSKLPELVHEIELIN